MNITVKPVEKKVNFVVGDIITFRNETEIRLISKVGNKYAAVDLKDGIPGPVLDSLDDLVEHYTDLYSVRVYKISNIELEVK